MRRTLALAVAAVVVFAPGWRATEDVRSAAPEELAGRVLAPTFEEGSAETRAKTRVERATTITESIDPLALSPIGVAPALPFELWGAIAGLLLVWASRHPYGPAPARAPPLHPAV